MQEPLESANAQAAHTPNQAIVQPAVPGAETSQLSQSETVPGRYRFIPFSLQHPGTSGVRNGNGSINSGKTDTEDPRKGYYLQQALKEAKFTGSLEQSIQTSLQMFNVYSKQFQLTNSQKSDLFIHALDGAARTFFFNNTNESMTFEQKVDIMLKEYDSDARQLQVKGRLDALRLKTFMTQHGINDVSDGLTKLVQQIDELTPQTHPDFRSDAHKISYLRKAVAEFQSWSRNPIQSIIANNHTFNSFVTALHEAIVLQKELELITNEMTGHTSTTGSSYFQQYAQNPRQLKSRRGGKQSGHRGRNLMTTPRTTYGSENNHRFEDARRKGLCFRCGQAWTRGHKCAKGAVRSYVSRRIKDGELSVHVVADLVRAMEEDTDDDNADNVDVNIGSHIVNESEIFESLMDSTAGDTAEALESEYITNHVSAAMLTQDSENEDF